LLGSDHPLKRPHIGFCRGTIRKSLRYLYRQLLTRIIDKVRRLAVTVWGKLCCAANGQMKPPLYKTAFAFIGSCKCSRSS